MTGTALLLMDVQNMVVANFAGEDSEGLLTRLASAADAARAANVPVIYVKVGFRPGRPEIGDHGGFVGVKSMPGFELDSEGMDIHPAVAPKDGDIVVVKKRAGAFVGGDLELILRAQRITHLVLTGIATSGVVLSTVFQALDLDFDLTVLRDGCADYNTEFHDFLLDKLFQGRTRVTDIASWVASLSGA